MSTWQPIPIGSRSYRPRSGTQAVERLINLYPEVSQPEAKTPVALYGTPGLKAWTSVGDGPTRGIHVANGYVWIVSGSKLYAVNQDTKVATTIGTILGAGPVRMIHDATHVVVCAQIRAYAATLTSLTELSQNNLMSATYQDGYGIYVERHTQKLWLSDSDDLSTITSTEFTTVDAQPDNVVAVISYRRQVWVLKEKTLEVFDNTGDPDFPFVRTGGGYAAVGCAAAGTLREADDSILWLGHDLRVRRATSYVPQVVSTPGIERLIKDAYAANSAEAFAYEQDGHWFYVLTFNDLTLVYDTTTDGWHERRSYGIDRWRVQHYGRVGHDTHLVGDYSNNQIYELDLDTYDEDGDILERIHISPPLSADPLPLFVHEMRLDFEAGVGLTAGQGSDPVVLLSWSDDDARTWSNDIEGSLGKKGEYRRRAYFNRLGRSINRAWRFRVTDPVKVAFLGASARIERAAS